MDTLQYTIENEALRLTVAAHGAEPVSVVSKKDGAELLWQVDPAVWVRQAPILFPYTGKLTDGKLVAKGAEYAGGQHGFARDMEHTLVEKTDTTLTLMLRADEKTRALWPYDFVLRSHFVVEGTTIHHTLTVENPTEPTLQFGIGYHPGFNLPFDDRHTTEDYELRFDELESPLCVSAMPNGLLSGRSYFLARNVESLPLNDRFFENDSHCMVNLKSHHLALVERDTGRSIRCEITGYPYVLVWSANVKPMRFLCIEPWQSLPGEENGPTDWEQRPCAARLKQGESWSTTLSTTFTR